MRLRFSLIATSAFCIILASLPAGVLPSSAVGVAAKVTKSVPIVRTVSSSSIEKVAKPNPTSTWPPAGFTSTNGVYARVPTGKELMSILVAKYDPSSPIARCAPDPKKPKTAAMSCGAVLVAATSGCAWWEINSTVTGINPSKISRCAPDPKKPKTAAMSCGAVLVAATSGCAWWEINSTVTGINPSKISRKIRLGSLRVLAGKTKSREIQTVILVSGVPLAPGVIFTKIVAKCWLTPPSEKIPSTVFTKPSSPTPAPFITPDATPTPTPAGSPSETPNSHPIQTPTETPEPSAP